MTPTEIAPERAAAARIKRRLFKTYAVLALFIAEKALGNLSLAWGMKHLSAGVLSAIFDPYVAAGIVALILAVLTRMVLLSLADLSFILPVTAVGYVITVILGHSVLHEAVSDRRWLGTILICIGAALVSSCTRTKTTRAEITKENRPR